MTSRNDAAPTPPAFNIGEAALIITATTAMMTAVLANEYDAESEVLFTAAVVEIGRALKKAGPVETQALIDKMRAWVLSLL